MPPFWLGAPSKKLVIDNGVSEVRVDGSDTVKLQFDESTAEVDVNKLIIKSEQSTSLADVVVEK
jgi:hypothetical protein